MSGRRRNSESLAVAGSTQDRSIPVDPKQALRHRLGSYSQHAMKPSMSDQPGRIPEWRDVDAATFRDEIVPRYRPAVLRGLVAKWPAVQRARTSFQAIGQYLSAFDKGGAVDVIIMPPH